MHDIRATAPRRRGRARCSSLVLLDQTCGRDPNGGHSVFQDLPPGVMGEDKAVLAVGQERGFEERKSVRGAPAKDTCVVLPV